jgi:hypothetical protein
MEVSASSGRSFDDCSGQIEDSFASHGVVAVAVTSELIERMAIQ